MKLIQRTYESEADYWAIRAFLRDVYVRNGRREHSWPAARLDYWRWHGIRNMGDGSLEEGVFLWETERGHLVAVLNREGGGQAYLQIDPEHRTPELETEMLHLAENHIMTIDRSSGRPVLSVWCTEGDALREAILAQHGFERKADWQQFIRYRDLSFPIPEVPMPAGYDVRPMRIEDIPSRSWASWRAFHPDEPEEEYEGHEWYANILCAPMYRRDLDLVAIADDGTVVAFCTVWYDDVTRSGYYEPVGTMPEHQRRGICSALLREGMRRLKERGATQASVGGGGLSNPPAEGVYARAFAEDRDSYVAWIKYMDGRPA